MSFLSVVQHVGRAMKASKNTKLPYRAVIALGEQSTIAQKFYSKRNETSSLVLSTSGQELTVQQVNSAFGSKNKDTIFAPPYLFLRVVEREPAPTGEVCTDGMVIYHHRKRSVHGDVRVH